MPSPPDDYDSRPKGSRYKGDIDDEDYGPPKRSSRKSREYDDYDDIVPPSKGKATEAPLPRGALDPRDVEPNMKAPRSDDRDKRANRYDDEDPGIEIVKKPGERGELRRKKAPKGYDPADEEDDGYTARPRAAAGGRPRGYPEEEDDGLPPRRSNTVRERPTYDDRDRGGRRGPDKYESSYDDLPRPTRKTRDYDDDRRDRGYRSDGRDPRKQRRDPYDDDDFDDRRGPAPRRRDPYDDRDRDRDRYRRSDRDRGSGYRSDGRDDYRSSRRGYESDRGSGGGYRSGPERDRYADRRDRDRDLDRPRRKSYYDDYDDRDRDRYGGGGRYRDPRDRYDDRYDDRRGGGGGKKKGFNFDVNNLPKYIEQGTKHYHTYKPLIDKVAGMYLNK